MSAEQVVVFGISGAALTVVVAVALLVIDWLAGVLTRWGAR